jgi:transcriptional regulator with XRE-family HTH domain
MHLFVDKRRKGRYKSPHMTLAEKLRKLRTTHELSMSAVARLSEQAVDHRGRITQGYISRLESGKETNPSLMKLMTLCRIYKIKPNDLFIKSGKKKS